MKKIVHELYIIHFMELFYIFFSKLQDSVPFHRKQNIIQNIFFMHSTKKSVKVWNNMSKW